MIKTTGLAATHMECRNLKESMAVLIDLLAFEKFRRSPGRRRSNIPTPIGCCVARSTGCADQADAQPLGRTGGQA